MEGYTIRYFVYILRCKDNTLYIGSTNNLKNRVCRHNQGQGARYTQQRLPVTLVYFEIFTTRKAAAQRELQLKRWSRIKKENLIKHLHPNNHLKKNN